MPRENDLAHYLTKNFVELLGKTNLSDDVKKHAESQEFEISFYVNLIDATLHRLALVLERNKLANEALILNRILHNKEDNSAELNSLLTNIYAKNIAIEIEAGNIMVEEFKRKCAEYGIILNTKNI